MKLVDVGRPTLSEGSVIPSAGVLSWASAFPSLSLLVEDANHITFPQPPLRRCTTVTSNCELQETSFLTLFLSGVAIAMKEIINAAIQSFEAQYGGGIIYRQTRHSSLPPRSNIYLKENQCLYLGLTLRAGIKHAEPSVIESDTQREFPQCPVHARFHMKASA